MKPMDYYDSLFAVLFRFAETKDSALLHNTMKEIIELHEGDTVYSLDKRAVKQIRDLIQQIEDEASSS